MSHISVRLSFVGALVVVALVCGLNGLAHQETPLSTEAATNRQAVVVAPRSTTKSVPTVLAVESKCSALDDRVTFVDNLAKLAQAVEPMTREQAAALARGALLRDVDERIPKIDVAALSRATTVCVVHHVNDDNEVVWRVEFPGNQQAITKGR